MGANLDYRVYQDGLGGAREVHADIEGRFERDTREARYLKGHGGYSGTIAEVQRIERFHDHELSSFEAALNYLRENAEKWEPAIAVSFYPSEDEMMSVRISGKCWLVGALCSS